MFSELSPSRRKAYLIGAAATFVWLALCVAYISIYVGWSSLDYLLLHEQAVAVCGVFTYEVAETKVSQVIDFARENQHPLQCTLEKA